MSGRPGARVAVAALAAAAACAGPGRQPTGVRVTPGPDAGVDAAIVEAPPPRWLRGSTHVHAAPSGDSTTDPAKVFAWYAARGYDFIVLSDHNRVTIPGADPGGRAAADVDGLLVIAGAELTYNPAACEEPAPPPDGKCRIHVNAIGATARPAGRLEWADRAARARLAMYRAALVEVAALGGVAQLNHPQWHWGLTAELLLALAGDGVALVEIANAQFARWNAGDAEHPSMEALWDAALVRGARLWGVASDDAHDYDGTGRYPAGGAWVMVDAPRDADAIVAALAAGRFYASTGVALARAGVDRDALVVELADGAGVAPGACAIDVIVDGAVVETAPGPALRYPLPPAGSYARAVVRCGDARAWVQPARR